MNIAQDTHRTLNLGRFSEYKLNLNNYFALKNPNVHVLGAGLTHKCNSLITYPFNSLAMPCCLLLLLRVLKTFLTCVGEMIQNQAGAEFVLSVAALLPSTMYSFRKILGIDRDSFERYVVCPKCTKLYRPEDCLRKVGNQTQPILCDNVLFPRSRRRKVCGSKLVKRVI